MRTHGVLPHLLVAAVAVGAAALVAEDSTDRVATVFRFSDPTISESSGLVDRGDEVLTVNDSGGDPVVYAVDSGSGATVGRTTYTTDAVVDVEALAPGAGGTVWVGDIGDNDAVRDHISIYEVPPVGRGDRTVTAQRFDLEYSDGPHDAEALLVHPRTGRVWVVTKGLLGGQVYAAPPLRTGTTNVLTPVRGASVGGLVTDGAFTRDGGRVVVRSYSRLVVLAVPGWRQLAVMRLPSQPQGEGLATTEDPGRVLVSSEGSRTPVLSVPLTDGLRSAIEGGSGQPAGSPAAPGGTERGEETDGGGVAVGPDDPLLSGRNVAVAVAALVVLAAGVAAYSRRRRT